MVDASVALVFVFNCSVEEHRRCLVERPQRASVKGHKELPVESCENQRFDPISRCFRTEEEQYVPHRELTCPEAEDKSCRFFSLSSRGPFEEESLCWSTPATPWLASTGRRRSLSSEQIFEYQSKQLTAFLLCRNPKGSSTVLETCTYIVLAFSEKDEIDHLGACPGVGQASQRLVIVNG